MWQGIKKKHSGYIMGVNCIVKLALFQFISAECNVNSKRFALYTLLLANLFWPAKLWAQVQLEIHGLNSTAGHVLLALYKADEDSSWLDQPLHTASIASQDATEGVLVYRVPEVLQGNYAVRLFHDENNNQRLDKAANGIPLESFAFSGEGPFTGIPDVEQAAFTVVSNEAQVVLTLRHPQQQTRE